VSSFAVHSEAAFEPCSSPVFSTQVSRTQVSRKRPPDNSPERSLVPKAPAGWQINVPIPATGSDSEDEDAALLRSKQEGPPGPAGAVPALPGIRGVTRPVASRRASLAQSVGWLCALRAMDLPLDRFHLGIGVPERASFLTSHNLQTVRQSPTPSRWYLMVLVKKVEVIAGEIEVIVFDPSGEMAATVDHRAPLTWARNICEGTALLLAGVLAVGRCRLLIMAKSIVRIFGPSDVNAHDTQRLLSQAAFVSR